MYCKAHRTLKSEGVILTAHGSRIGSVMQDGSPTPAKLRQLIKRHKVEILQELKNYRPMRVFAEDFYGPGLMADAAERANRRNNHE